MIRTTWKRDNGRIVFRRDGEVVASFGSVEKLADHFADLDAAYRELRAIVDKLPKTADGVSVVPHVDIVWAICNGRIESRHWYRGDRSWVYGELSQYTVRVDECYSTRAAAEAAKGVATKAIEARRCRLSEGSDGDTWAGCVLDAGHEGGCDMRPRPQKIREAEATEAAKGEGLKMRHWSVRLSYLEGPPGCGRHPRRANMIVGVVAESIEQAIAAAKGTIPQGASDPRVWAATHLGEVDVVCEAEKQ